MKRKGVAPMGLKKGLSMVIACIIFANCFCLSTVAVSMDIWDADGVTERATGRFSMDIPGNTAVQASTSFPLEAGEMVTIKASYTPFSASVDFGLIEPDGTFLFVNVTDGSVDQEIEIERRGQYTLAIRNNSSKEISVSGFINY